MPDGQQDNYRQSLILAGVLAASMNGVIAYQSVRDAKATIIDFQILCHNQVAEQMLALPPDAVGQTLLTLFPDVKPAGLFDQYVQVVEQDYPIHLETPFNAGVVNGWFEIQVAKMDDGFVIAFQDITSRKTAEQQAAQLRSILDGSINSIMALEAIRSETGDIVDFNILTANRAAEEYLNSSVAEMEGQQLLDLFPENRVMGLFAMYVQAIETGQPQRMEAHYDQDGDDYWLDESATPYGHDALVVTFLDRTVEKKAQQALIGEAVLFKTLSNNVPETGVLVCDHNLRVLFANGDLPPAFRLPQTEITNRRLADALQENWYDPVRQSFMRALSGQSHSMTEEVSGQFYEVFFAPVLNDKGETLMAMVTFRNITGVTIARQELEALVQELKRSNDNLEQFAYVASHDLQEPLRKVQAFGDILANQFAAELGETGTDLVRRMQSAASRMSILIRDILAYSRLTTQQAPFTPLNLNPIVQHVLDDLETTIHDKRAVIKVDPMPKQFSGDAGQLRQLFQNLLTNALKFTRSGIVPEINITCDKKRGAELTGLVPSAQARKEFYCIQIIDNGIGFDPKQAGRIFQVFQRLHGRSEYQGTGIGLAIVQKVVDNHRGYIMAEGRPGAGATFTVAIPVR
jgi:signal transduction histidine kinase